ncbi:MAG: S1 RNA-binding domain-containing protein [Anaerolineae bacterium]|jgi:small subunit ribosomal protein S1|nr:S1 RNA-binding domain-containing protein [Anaerolineae bacterium]
MKTHKTLQSAQIAGEPNPMDTLPLDLLSFSELRQGDTVEGTIVSIHPNQVLVAIPYKADAIVDPRELERLGREFLDAIAVGDPISAVVVQPEDRDGNVVISLARAQQEQDWRQAEELFQSQDVFEGVVTGFNRGGVIVRVGRVRGFVPASQLSARWQAQQDAEGDPEQRWARLVGQSMQLKVVEMDRQRNRLILSERAAMRDWRKNQKDRLLSTLSKGDVLKGIVTSIADFGAFVDLGGADGLIHLSELAWHRVEHPREILRVGQEVEVYVMNVDEERKRIGLSLRRLTPEPWSIVADQYEVGQVVTATITRLAAFGAFAKMDDSIEGLIHISEMADYRINHPKEIVQEGDEVQVRVIRIDPQHRRIGLSLRQASDEAYVDWQADADEATEDAVEIVAEEALSMQ